VSELAESVARELLSRDGVAVIWPIHLAAAAAHRLDHDQAASKLLRIADAAETIWRDEVLHRQ
jgi:hypothetical protein